MSVMRWLIMPQTFSAELIRFDTQKACRGCSLMQRAKKRGICRASGSQKGEEEEANRN
jgi:hypothetical protein